MYYYTISEDDKILDQSFECPDPQQQADFFKCQIYIIKGEYTGLGATPTSMESQDDD